ncbi:zinc finger and SCAN domain-containing protein 12-like isoform X2 [Astatotilapia calliptera]|uniref:zinc finger and SCAN domain-containing protein 12-like isoform X2 n=1 Tax=Astatotilapia calliptera TaxID=8154 RepID=UPI000E3FB1BE|nr:zinc finger and SCAN domain-containing protein 12-like isoform X2 [Astatotilapia calliptera]
MLVLIRPVSVEAAMSSVQYLREFIKERLTAVCEEIFSEVQKTIVQYEEEINRQHRLLDISRKPDRNSHIIDPLQQHNCKEEEDPEPPQIYEEQEELCSSQEGEQLGLLETICEPDIMSHRIDLQQQHVGEEEEGLGEEEEGLDEQQVCNQERNSSLDQEDPEPPQIKEEQEELCSSQEGEQLGLKQEADALAENTAASESQTEAREKSLQCDTCGKTFQYKCLLAAHLTVHTGEKRFPCSKCGKKFSQLTRLKNHMRIHTGEKSYPCSTCGKEFSKKSALKSHARVHTGEKHHCCSICGESFIWNMQLIRHRRIHTD